jgi:D-inositol-3-phosphate glycosyltransferase
MLDEYGARTFSQGLRSAARKPSKYSGRLLEDPQGSWGGRMPTSGVFTKPRKHLGAVADLVTKPPIEIEVGLLTGCQDRPYAFGLAMVLVSKGVRLDVIGSDEVDSSELHSTPKLRFLNLRGSQRQQASFQEKLYNIMIYYARLLRYAARTKPKIFHILWNNKFEYLDRTLMMVYYKALRKKIVITAHNVNQGRRDSNDSLFNRLTLRIQYRLADHIFVHTQRMKGELRHVFGISDQAITVLRHPINNAFPDTDLSPAEAKQQLEIRADEKTILFLGRIRPYKGLEHLLDAFRRIVKRDMNYRLIIAGEPKKGSEKYLDEIWQTVHHEFDQGNIVLKIQFIPDAEMELYLKAADVLVLPYKEIFQSGVLFLAYSFGLPVVATDVGSFREEIIEGRTGFLCKPGDPIDMAQTIEAYFSSELYRDLSRRRQEIRDYAYSHHSWDAVGDLTRNVYVELLRTQLP